ncbi:MAG: YafY family transcriptional regulator [Cytophagales bacterium]|nr:YafY family transcriptional regulator [Cytophagales bacterium]
MNRIDRLQAILIQLQSKRVITAQEMADRFEVSLRTIYRDIRALEEGGVPIGAEAGIGYYLSEGYHLPPIMFTREEACALLMAGKIFEKHTDKNLQAYFKDALFKVKAVLDMGKKEELEDLEEKISIDPFGWQYRDHSGNLMVSRIQSILPSKKLARIRYHASYSGESTERIVEPIGLCFYSNQWHLIAFCQLRNDYRDFRTDRIEQLDVIPGKFSKTDHISLQLYLETLQQGSEVQIARIRFPKEFVRFIDEVKYQFGWVDQIEIGKEIEMKFAVMSMDLLARWLLMSGKNFTVMSPDRLEKRIKELILELQQEHF